MRAQFEQGVDRRELIEALEAIGEFPSKGEYVLALALALPPTTETLDLMLGVVREGAADPDSALAWVGTGLLTTCLNMQGGQVPGQLKSWFADPAKASEFVATLELLPPELRGPPTRSTAALVDLDDSYARKLVEWIEGGDPSFPIPAFAALRASQRHDLILEMANRAVDPGSRTTANALVLGGLWSIEAPALETFVTDRGPFRRALYDNLLRELGDPDPKDAEEAAYVQNGLALLSVCGDDELTERAIKAIAGSSSERYRTLAMHSSRSIAARPRVRQVLLERLQDEHESTSVRRAAIAALLELFSDEGVIARFTELATSSVDPTIRSACSKAIKQAAFRRGQKRTLDAERAKLKKG